MLVVKGYPCLSYQLLVHFAASSSTHLNYHMIHLGFALPTQINPVNINKQSAIIVKQPIPKLSLLFATLRRLSVSFLRKEHRITLHKLTGDDKEVQMYCCGYKNHSKIKNFIHKYLQSYDSIYTDSKMKCYF